MSISAGLQTSSSRSNYRWIIFISTYVLFCGISLGLIWGIHYLPLQDYPDHLARAYIFIHLNDNSFPFSEYYTPSVKPAPNILTDILLIALGWFIPVDLAGRILLSVNLLGLPISFAVFLATSRHPNWQILSLWGLLFSSSHFFWRGYLNFCMGLWILFITLACFLKYVENNKRVFAIFSAIGVILTYFAHLVPFAILVASIAIIMISKRKFRLPILISIFAGIIIGSYYWLRYRPLIPITWFPPFSRWFLLLLQPFMLFHPSIDLVVMIPALLIWICLAWMAIASIRHSSNSSIWIFISGLSAVLALVVPDYGQRFLLISLLMILPAVPEIKYSYQRLISIILFGTIFVRWLGQYSTLMQTQPRFIELYACLAKVHENEPLGVINQTSYIGSINPYLHFGDYAVIYKHVLEEGLFTTLTLIGDNGKLPANESPLPSASAVSFYPQFILVGPENPVPNLPGFEKTFSQEYCSYWEKTGT